MNVIHTSDRSFITWNDADGNSSRAFSESFLYKMEPGLASLQPPDHVGHAACLLPDPGPGKLGHRPCTFTVGTDDTPRAFYKFVSTAATTVTVSPEAVLAGCELSVVAVGGGGRGSGLTSNTGEVVVEVATWQAGQSQPPSIAWR